MIGDIEKMIAVGLVWGSTNAIMRRGALIWDRKARSSSTQTTKPSTLHQRLLATYKNWLNLLLTWQYSIPFLINLSASATFFAILSDTPISLAVPVTNATTFAATAVSAMLLGEETRVWLALLGTFLIVLGVWICIMWCILWSWTNPCVWSLRKARKGKEKKRVHFEFYDLCFQGNSLALSDIVV